MTDQAILEAVYAKMCAPSPAMVNQAWHVFRGCPQGHTPNDQSPAPAFVAAVKAFAREALIESGAMEMDATRKRLKQEKMQ